MGIEYKPKGDFDTDTSGSESSWRCGGPEEEWKEVKSKRKRKNSKVNQPLVVYNTTTDNAYSSLATDTDPQQQPVQLC